MSQIGEAHGGSTFYQAGRDVTVRAAPAVPVMESLAAGSWVRRVPVVPGSFVGRTAELARLDAAATSGGRAVVVAVHGLGGVGKSTLAARFAADTERFAPVWWITADSPAALDTGLADLAVALAPGTAELTSEHRVELAVRWLASHDGWLLVLDNLTGPADAAQLLERVRTGTVLITSRQAGGWHGTTVAVDVLPPAEAVELLTRIVRDQWPDADLADAERLCAELGWLPLAVEQAAAYLAQSRITPTAYLDLLRRYPARMFTTTAEGGDAQRTAARVWHVTLDRLADTPLAGHLLRFLAWFAPDDIPRHLLDEDDPDVVHALGRLAAYSMITLTADTISVHRLVQAVTRTPDPDDPHRQPGDITTSRDTAALALVEELRGTDPQLPSDWAAHRRVLPHAQSLLDHTSGDRYDVFFLANELGLYLVGQGDTTTAIALLTRAVDCGERLRGPEHPSTLTVRNNLATAYESAGDAGRAVELCEAILASRERVLGPDHPDTLFSRNNLAAAYESTGDLERAVALSKAMLSDCLRVLGPDHPTTLSSRNNLAAAYGSAGDPERALPLLELVVADRERVLGSDHPDTLLSRNNLATVRSSVGDVDRAVRLLAAALIDAERVLGAGHPTTRLILANLKAAKDDLGR
ncbi:tetratricopeptide repeat protein [Actinosynnema sp. NPDC091369]